MFSRFAWCGKGFVDGLYSYSVNPVNSDNSGSDNINAVVGV